MASFTLERACGELPRPACLRWASVLFTLFVLALQISIAAAQIFLAASGVCYAVYLLRTRVPVAFLPVKAPLLLFCGWSVISVFFAANPAAGWFAVRKLVLFLIWLLAVNVLASGSHVRRLLQSLFVISLVTSLVAIGQFIVQYRYVRAHFPGQVYHQLTSLRIHGFMGHWMHFGGQQMLIFPFLLAFLLGTRAGYGDSETGSQKTETREPGPGRISSFEFRVSSFGFRVSPLWWIVFVVVVTSIILNFTRGVWLGCFIAGIYLIARWRARWLWALPVALLVGYLGAPPLLRERLNFALHPKHEPALSIRLEMWQDALRMIRAHPWVGVGPNNIEEVYDLYLPPGRSPEVGYHGHFHNDYLQFAAERGLPCLAAWVWLMAALGWSMWRIRSKLTPAQKWIADAAFAGWLAFLAEGFFEFNFGTSPVLMMFLFVTATPLMAARAPVASGGDSL